MPNKYLVQSDWLTELPTIEKPMYHGDNDTWSGYLENHGAYLSHLASLPKICRCEGLKDGVIVEEGVDFQYKRGKQLHTTDQQQWQEMSVSEKDEYFEKVAIPLHREQGEEDSPRLKEAMTGIRVGFPPSPQSEQTGEKVEDAAKKYEENINKGWYEDVRERCAAHFTAGALWQAASQEKGVRVEISDDKKWYAAECSNCGWFGSSEFLEGGTPIADTGDFTDPLCPICLSIHVDSADEIIPIESFPDRLQKSLKILKWYHESYTKEHDKVYGLELQLQSPAPDTVQGQDELWMELYAAIISAEKNINYRTDDKGFFFSMAIPELKSKFTLTKNS